jgi:hypothetical protein
MGSFRKKSGKNRRFSNVFGDMSKNEADWCKKIEVWWLLKDIKNKGGYKHSTISWGENGSRGSITAQVNINGNEKYVRFIYTQTDNYSGEKTEYDYKVKILETKCHYGGVRYWFQCPLSKKGVYCGKRVGVLYKDGDYFGCRNCYELTYSSRNENRQSKWYSMMSVLKNEKKVDDLYAKNKRLVYAGKPTKTAERINKLNAQTFQNYLLFERVNKGLRNPKKGRKNKQ